MRLRIPGFVFCLLLLSSFPAFGQDLAKLRQRILKLWDLRQQPNKRIEALAFIEPESKELFLHFDEPQVTDFKISAFQPTDDDNRLYVLMDTHVQSPYGVLNRSFTEAWVWRDGDWFMEIAKPILTGTDKNARVIEAPKPPEFHLPSDSLDLGRHRQGEVLSGQIPFSANSRLIRGVWPTMNVPGLLVSQPVWSSESDGFFPYTWETALLSQNTTGDVALTVQGVDDLETTLGIHFSVQIEPRIRFRQIPEIVDTAQSGELELEIFNPSKTVLKIVSVATLGPAYKLEGNMPETVQPGKGERLKIRYDAQPSPMGAALDFMLSEPITPSGIIRLPLNVKLPPPPPAPSRITPEMRRLGDEEFKKGR